MTEPKSQRPRGERIATRILLVAVIVFIVALVGTFIKMPYAIERPGPVTNTIDGADDEGGLITVDGARTYPTKGELYFTTVRVLGGPERHVTVWEYLFAKIDPSARVVPEEQVFGDRTPKEVEEANEAMMVGSQHTAVAVGMRSTGLEVPAQTSVGQVAKGKPAAGKLKVEDVIVSVDGKKISGVAEVADAIADRDPGERVEIGYLRDGERGSVTLTTTDLGQGKAGIGVVLQPTYDYPFEVKIDAGDVGGPSAGMMFALAVRDELTPGAMTGGKSIAGTGTISDDEKVGAIGGIAQKMIGAEEGGAKWFLAPEANCDEVVGNVPDGLTVVPVSTFDEAVSAVEAISHDPVTATLPSCSTSSG